MSWAKVDDRAAEHRKLLAAGLEACALWVWGLCYANRQPARDGFIPSAGVAMLYPLSSRQLKALPAKLVEVGLWEQVPGGYQVHDFLDWNDSREQVEARREATRNRVARHRGSAVGNAVTPSVSNATVLDPLHSAPQPLQSLPLPEAPAATAEPSFDERETPIPLGLAKRLIGLGVHVELAEALRVDVDSVAHELEQFEQYWAIGGGTGERRRHWPRRAREWVREQAKQNKLTPPGAIGHAQANGQTPRSKARVDAIYEQVLAEAGGKP